MLIPRSPLPRRLASRTARCSRSAGSLWLGVVVMVGAAFFVGIFVGTLGCQPPDTFLRKDEGSMGGAPGQGGFAGLGGSPGLGGFVGLGGGSGQGGAPGQGGMPAAGGRGGAGGVGAGGRAAGGTTGAGGRAAGGATGTGGATGQGGATDAGAADRPGAGGMVGAGGTAGMDAGTDGDSGMVGGTGPCAGLCANPIVLNAPTSLGSTDQGPDATCYEASGTYGGGNCGNFVAPRAFSINGVVVPICTTPNGNGGGNFTLPTTRRNGGYCFQSTAGQFPYAYFGLF